MAAKDIYGLIGYPLGHSFSRAFFTEKFEKEGINAEYLNFQIEDIELLPQIIARHPGLRGFNVTIPYKEKVIPFLKCLSDEAVRIGAVNVVKVEADGTLKGYNSDVYGFVESLRPLLAEEVRGNDRALVLGVGGASKAVCYGLRKLGLEVTQVSRREGVGDLTYGDLTPLIIATHRVIVNTTPLGMYPKTDACPDIPYGAVTQGHVCFDLVYNPEETLFMKRCAAQGAKVKNGLEMLHLQAVRAWEIWTAANPRQL